MAIRDKIKAKFSKGKSSSVSSSPPKDGAIPGHYTGRTDIEYYKPHEIPKSKYRGRVDKDHQNKLEAFSFGETFQVGRRPSVALSGTFSPGGTKAFSRRTSYASNAEGQTSARSQQTSLSSDGNASFSIPSSESDSPHLNSAVTAALARTELTDVEHAEYSDGANTDVHESDVSVPLLRLEREATITEKDTGGLPNHAEHSQTADPLPFTAEELTHAMTQVTITPQFPARRTSVAVG